MYYDIVCTKQIAKQYHNIALSVRVKIKFQGVYFIV